MAGVGTGGTITGAGRYLKEKNSAVYIAAVEPADSAVLSGGKAGPHGIQGIGAGFVPAVLDTGVYNEVLRVETQQAFAAARSLARHEGLLAGISSGAALGRPCSLPAGRSFKIKLWWPLLPDTGERYLSTGLFATGAVTCGVRTFFRPVVGTWFSSLARSWFGATCRKVYMSHRLCARAAPVPAQKASGACTWRPCGLRAGPALGRGVPRYGQWHCAAYHAQKAACGNPQAAFAYGELYCQEQHLREKKKKFIQAPGGRTE